MPMGWGFAGFLGWNVRFNIDGKFHQEFGKATPPLTAFGFQMNTKNTTDGAKAFVKKITFYGK